MSIELMNKLSQVKALDKLSQSNVLKTKDNAQYKNKELTKLPIDLVESDEQVRKIFENIESLAQSIQSSGLLSPIRVRPQNANGKYKILEGERRWRACKLLGLTEIDAIIDFSTVDEPKRLINQLSENLQRDDMRPLEIARAIEELLGQGLSCKEIAVKLGHHATFVSLYKDLIELPDYLRELGSTTIRDAKTLQILKRIYVARPDIAVELIEANLDRNRKISRTKAKELHAQCIKVPNSQNSKGDSKMITTIEASIQMGDELINESTKTPTSEFATSSTEEGIDISPLPGENLDDKPSISRASLVNGGNGSTYHFSLPKHEECVEDCPQAIPAKSVQDAPLPYGAVSHDIRDVSIEVEIVEVDLKSSYGLLCPWILNSNSSELCVYAQGEYRFIPTHAVRILKVESKKPLTTSSAGW